MASWKAELGHEVHFVGEGISQELCVMYYIGGTSLYRGEEGEQPLLGPVPRGDPQKTKVPLYPNGLHHTLIQEVAQEPSGPQWRILLQ
jgi:hypothetical protein